MYSELIQKAVAFAAKAHEGQKRIGKDANPYIAHLVSVAFMVSEHHQDEELISAALLHDTLEDTVTTRDDLLATFTPRVTTLVEEVSEDKELPWDERKSDYVARLAASSMDALVLALADKIDNLQSKLTLIAEEGLAVTEQWGHPAEAYLAVDESILSHAQARIPEHPFTEQFAQLIAQERGIVNPL